MYYKEKTWEEARQSCATSGGHLAYRSNARGFGLITDQLHPSSPAWVGARVGPHSWNWVTETGVSIPVYYQGCYKTDKNHYGMSRNCTAVDNVSACGTHCQNQGYPYFNLRERRVSETQYRCCCGDVLGTGTVNGCRGRPRLCPGGHICNNSSVAVYAVNRTKGLNFWKTRNPITIGPEQTNCMSLKVSKTALSVREQETEVYWLSQRCSMKLKGICKAESDGTKSCRSLGKDWIIGKHSDSCLRETHDKLDWTEAYRSCQDLNGTLLTMYDEKFVKDLRSIVYQGLGFRDTYWLSATSGQWLRTEKSTGRPTRMGNPCKKCLPFPDTCLEVSREGQFVPSGCKAHLPYICQLPQVPPKFRLVVPASSVSWASPTTHHGTETTAIQPVHQRAVSSWPLTLPTIVSLTGLTVLVVIVAALIIWKKRTKAHQERQTSKTTITSSVGDNSESRGARAPVPVIVEDNKDREYCYIEVRIGCSGDQAQKPEDKSDENVMIVNTIYESAGGEKRQTKNKIGENKVSSKTGYLPACDFDKLHVDLATLQIPISDSASGVYHEIVSNSEFPTEETDGTARTEDSPVVNDDSLGTGLEYSHECIVKDACDETDDTILLENEIYTE